MARPRTYASRGTSVGVLAPYRYELTPWVWDATAGPRPFWRMPASAVGGVDLRSLPHQGAAGPTAQGRAFAALRNSAGGVTLGHYFHMSEATATTTMRDAWQSGTGYRPAGATMTDLLADQLTTGSDPSGASGPKPLVPGVDNVLRIHVGGHSQVWSQPFRYGHHPHTNRLRDLLRLDFEGLWEATGGAAVCRKALGYQLRKYRLADDDWRELVPARLRDHVPGPLRPETTITESFNKADSDTLGPDLSWTEIAGDADVVSNQYRTTTTANPVYARANSDLSSDDHYAQAVAGANDDASHYGGVIFRKDSTATLTFYFTSMAWGEDRSRLYKKVADADTELGFVSRTFSSGTTYTTKGQADGSTIKALIGGVEDVSVTDTAITGNLRCGLGSYVGSGYVTFDSFEAADLTGGGGGSIVPLVMHRRRMMARAG